MKGAVCDASVAVKWFHHDREHEVAEAYSILESHLGRQLRIQLLDLVFYEVGNVMARRLRLPGREVSDRLDDLQILCQYVFPMTVAIRREAAMLAADRELSFYDAAHWALAREIGLPLVTADRALIEAGAGVSPTEFAASL